MTGREIQVPLVFGGGGGGGWGGGGGCVDGPTHRATIGASEDEVC